MNTEKIIIPISGFLAIVVLIVTLVLIPIAFEAHYILPGALLLFLALIIVKGIMIISPNESKVLLLFGKYRGSVKNNGLFWVNPLYTRTGLSLRARNLESEKIKVNDKMGNPIMISVILVWRVKDTFKSTFEVDDYEYFIKIQTDSAVRKLAGSFPYDHFEDERATVTLSTNFDD